MGTLHCGYILHPFAEGRRSMKRGESAMKKNIRILCLVLAVMMLAGTLSACRRRDPGMGKKDQLEADVHVHTWQAATCLTARYCTGCGQTSGTPMGHDWAEATYDTPQRCRTCGVTDGTAVQRQLVSEPVSYATASSTYSGDRATHGASNLLDGRLDTNWTEGVDGNGEWEYVDFYFYDEYLLTAMTIYAGNHASAAYYEYNARPYRVELMFSDGTFLYYNLMDKMEPQVIIFDEPVTASSMRISIESVYKGSKWEDTVISEVAFTAYE